MAIDEIRQLRYCYQVLKGWIESEGEHLPYWRMNLKIATYFLKRYDAEFSEKDLLDNRELEKSEQEWILKTHPLLKLPEAGRGEYPKLTKELELELKRRIEKFIDSRK